MVRNTAPLLQLTKNPRGNPVNEIEMDDMSIKSKSAASSQSGESEDFKKFSEYSKAEKFSLLIPVISILISVYVIFKMIVSHGPEALFICRIYSLYSILFLILTFSCMLWNVTKIRRSGHFRRKFIHSFFRGLVVSLDLDSMNYGQVQKRSAPIYRTPVRGVFSWDRTEKKLSRHFFGLDHGLLRSVFWLK